RAGGRRLEALRLGAPRCSAIRRDRGRSRRRVPAPHAQEGPRDRDGARAEPVGQRRAPAGGAPAGAAGGAAPGAPGRRHGRPAPGRSRGRRERRQRVGTGRSGPDRRVRARRVLGGEPDAGREPRPARGLAGARVRRAHWLGAPVMRLPASRALRPALDGERLRLAGPWAAVLGDQALADVLVTYPRSWSGRLSTADTVRGFGGTTAVLLPTSFEAAASALYWGARRRIGFAMGGRRWLLTDPVPLPEPRLHQVDEYARLVERLGVA